MVRPDRPVLDSAIRSVTRHHCVVKVPVFCLLLENPPTRALGGSMTSTWRIGTWSRRREAVSGTYRGLRFDRRPRPAPGIPTLVHCNIGLAGRRVLHARMRRRTPVADPAPARPVPRGPAPADFRAVSAAGAPSSMLHGCGDFRAADPCGAAPPRASMHAGFRYS